MKCGLIITTDSDPTDTTAKVNPAQHFLTSINTERLPNVDTLPATPDALSTEIVNAAHDHYPTTN